MAVVDARRSASVGRLYASPQRPPEDDWIGIAGASFVAVIESGGDDRGIAELVRLAGQPNVPLEAIVSAIPVGEPGKDSFAVVHVDDLDCLQPGAPDGSRRITAVARGRAVVDVFSEGGSRRFSSSGIRPWLIATFRDVIAVELGGPARRTEAVARLAPDAEELFSQARPAGSLLWSFSESGPPYAVGTAEPYLRPAAALDDDTVRSLDDATVLSMDDDTVRSIDVAEAHDSVGGHGVDDETVRRSPAFPGLEAELEDEADTVLETDTETEAAPEVVPDSGDSGAPDGDPADQAPAVLVGVHGEQAVLLEGPIVFGRRPGGVARGGIPPLLVTVASRDSLISSSHVRVERVGSVVVVTDLRSRNGTAMIVPGAAPRRLRPGESFAVVGAAQVDIGDGTIIEITPVARTEGVQCGGGRRTTTLRETPERTPE